MRQVWIWHCFSAEGSSGRTAHVYSAESNGREACFYAVAGRPRTPLRGSEFESLARLQARQGATETRLEARWTLRLRAEPGCPRIA